MSSERDAKTDDLEFRGWLDKWTSFLKGYRRRWFVLRDGKLSYYKTEDQGKTPRDTINLVDAVIMLDDPRNIVVSDNQSRSFHLRARTETERQQWLTALELSKSRAIRKEEELEEERLRQAALMSSSSAQAAKIELQNFLEKLKTSLEETAKNCEHALRLAATLPDDMDQMSFHHYWEERETLDALSQWLRDLQSSTNEMVISSTKCIEMARTEHRCWRQLLMERERRESLERTLESLAREHSDLQESVTEFNNLTKKYACVGERHSSSEDNREAMDYIIRNMWGRIRSLSIVPRPSISYSISSETESLETRLSTKMEDIDEEEEHLSENSEEGETANVTGATGICPVSSRERIPPIDEDTLRAHNLYQRRSTIFGGTWTKIMPLIITGGRDIPTKRVRRTTIPERPNIQTSMWSVLKNCIGKDLTKISMPIVLSEPLSALQRLTGEYEYSELLDMAALCDDCCEQMVYITAFVVSSVCATSLRTAKPFNPLLGETFECDRTEDFGWRCISEQVSHHPAVASQHCEGRGWTCWQEFASNVMFLGQYIRLTPLGITHLEFSSTGYHYTWKKVPTTLHNLIVGTIVVENHGDMTITNHTTGETSCLTFHPLKRFTWEKPRRVTGVVLDNFGEVAWVLQGAWDDYMEAEIVIHKGESKGGKPVLTTSNAQLIWKRRVPPEEYERIYYFSPFICQLNEPEPGVAPTDSRHRPDIRSMENGDFDAAAELKNQLENKQRWARKKLDEEAELALAEGRPMVGYKPAWFNTQKDPITGKPIFVYAGKYWQCKEMQDWSKCPDIFL